MIRRDSAPTAAVAEPVPALPDSTARSEKSAPVGAAFVELLVGPDQILRLAFQLLRHAVEGAVEQANLVRPGAPLDPPIHFGSSRRKAHCKSKKRKADSRNR